VIFALNAAALWFLMAAVKIADLYQLQKRGNNPHYFFKEIYK